MTKRLMQYLGARYSHLFPVFLSCAVFLFSIGDAPAEQGGTPKIMLSPTHVIFEGNDRSADITLVNNGTAKGAYRIDVVTMVMKEDGPLEELQEGQTSPYSAAELFRLSPRRIMLPPGSNQKVRLLLRLPPDLADGEYRAHLRVRSVNIPPEESGSTPDLTMNSGKHDSFDVDLRPDFDVLVPVVIRHGKTTYRGKITDIALAKDYLKRDSVNTIIAREGNRSIVGTLIVNYIDPAGQSFQIGRINSAVIYRDVTQRRFQIPIHMPSGLASIGHGKLQVIYRERLNEKANDENAAQMAKMGAVIAEAELEI